jgi:FAD/FMN-containing dehydrogenase
MQFIEDGAVPLPRLPEYVTGIREALAARQVSGVIFGHAGDAHVHVNPLVDVRQSDWRDRVSGLLDDVVKLTAGLGGTLTGEHGDGRIRTPLLDQVWPKEALRTFALVKKAFDPENIFNPGVKVPLPGQRAITDIKYDLSLPPLPEAARKALDDLVSQRAYSRFRLSLIESPS